MQVRDWFVLYMIMEDQKLILPNVISNTQPIQCPTQLKIESFIEAKFKALEKRIHFSKIKSFFFSKRKEKKKKEDKNWLAKITVP